MSLVKNRHVRRALAARAEPSEIQRRAVVTSAKPSEIQPLETPRDTRKRKRHECRALAAGAEASEIEPTPPPRDWLPDPDVVVVPYKGLAALGICYTRVGLTGLIAQKKFPPPIRLSNNRVAWRLSDLKTWIESRPTVIYERRERRPREREIDEDDRRARR